ncbi:acyltransferase family protein [Paludibacterium yongneupense]|uniref:acyltransferase family protein n=1 Tax=Paludibacterium yongneupense TaxID=400061 RepID=UPI00146B50D1|nr:acyltransferase [Paludibacterium yongneupense]
MTAANIAIENDRRVLPFDFLRGIAIIGVIAIHAVSRFPTMSSTLNRVVNLGHFGVQLFFMVSAMTMCHMWDIREGENFRTLKFYIRRMMRIAPMFWLAIPVYLLINGTEPGYWAPQGISARQIVLTATFMHGFWPDSFNAVVPGGWSIAVEMTFYLVFPFIISRTRNQYGFLWLAAGAYFLNALAIAPATTLFFNDHYHVAGSILIANFLYYNFFNQLPIFFLGMAIYHKGLHGEKIIIAWILTSLLLAYTKTISHQSFYFVLAIITMYYSSAFAIKKSLHNAAINELGRNSYVIYLSHFIIMNIIGHALRLLPRLDNVAFVFAIVSTTALGYLVSRLAAITIDSGSHALTRKWINALG